MISRLTKWAVLLVLLGCLVLSPATLAQSPSAVSVFSVWVRLSLRGFTQQEIESVLRNMDEKTLLEVKGRLRSTVLANLELKKVRKRYLTSQDKDDLNSIRSSIETEIRFAGLQNDASLKQMIKDRFGIPVSSL